MNPTSSERTEFLGSSRFRMGLRKLRRVGQFHVPLTAIPLIVGVICLAATASAQKLPADRLEAIIQVSRDTIGANLVRVSSTDPHYSVELLRKQVQALGQQLNGSARGLQISSELFDPKDPNSRSIHATFAVDGLIDRSGLWVKAAPVVRAFAGTAREPGFSNFQVDFDLERPSAVDLVSYESPQVALSSRIVDRTIEYSILVKQRDSNGISVPDFAPSEAQNKIMVRTVATDWFNVGLAAVAIVATGALVYCLLLIRPSMRRNIK